MIFTHSILSGLYNDAQKNRGTDLEVKVPKEDGLPENVSFHLHHNIVAASSEYFATFPEPKLGRIIDNINAKSFSICVKFMYTGEYRDDLSHGNISSILYASEMLVIDELKHKCIEYLETNLDHSNYEQVIELADQFQIPHLKEVASRYQTENSARDVLLSKRGVLVKDIEHIKYEEKELSKRKKAMQDDLKRIDEQLKNIYSKQHEQIMLSKVSTDTNVGHPKRLEAGSIGHIVYAQPDEGYGEYWYRGSSKYGGMDTGPDNPSDDESFYCQPPPPTKDQYEDYGIVSSHSSLMTAIKAATDGDCIYLLEGLHYEESSRHMDKTIAVEKSLSFVGLGDANKIIVSVDHDSPFVVRAGAVSFVNMTFSTDMSLRPEGCEPFKSDSVPWFRHKDGPTTSKGLTIPIMCFGDEEGSYPLGDYKVKDCLFDLGSTCEKADATRVSGILIRRGKSALIEGCRFIGGAGSAIVTVNDPHLFTPSIEITRNIFMNNGQPTFYEKPAAEMIPGPSSVECWRFNRPLYQISESGTKEEWKRISLKFSNNQLSSNLRAPLAYRDVSPSGKETSEWKLYVNMPTGEKLQSLVPGYDLVVSENVFKSNGLQLKDSVGRMLGKTQAKEDEKEEGIAKFPDGQSLLVIKHVLSYNDECSFPDGWGNGVPYLEYHEDYTYGHDYY